MRTTTIAIGFVFGIILASVLVAPLYMALPARYVDNWYFVSSSGALGGLFGGIAVVGAAGFFAALASEGATIINGTYAGFLASVVASALIALPASSIEASGSLLSLAAYETITLDRLAEATASAAISSTWIPAVVGLVLASVGASLGAIGAVIYDLWQGSPGRSARLVRRSLVPFVGLVGVALASAEASIWASHIDRTVLVGLSDRAQLSYVVGFYERTLLSLPLLAAGIAASWLFAWGMRDVVVTWRDDRRLSALIWMSALGVLALAGPVLALIFYLPSFQTPVPYVAIAAAAIMGIVGLVGTARSEIVREPHPRVFGEVFADVMLASILFSAIQLFVSGSAIIGALSIVFPYVRALFSRALFVDAPPSVVVSWVFYWHWGLFVLSTIAILLFSVSVASTWAFGRAIRR